MKAFLRTRSPRIFAAVKRLRWELHFLARRPLPGDNGHHVAWYLLDCLSGCIAGGPFKGMRYIDEAIGSSLCPKILGTYESELGEFIEELIGSRHDCILNVGCAEGYYAVGLALRTRDHPNLLIHAYDSDTRGRAATLRLATENGVAQRIIIGDRCDHHELNRFIGKRLLVVCDIEGAESELLDPQQATALLDSDILVEVHDGPDNDLIHQLLINRFKSTHTIRSVRARPRTLSDFPYRHILVSHRWRRLSLDEGRHFGIEWLLMRPLRPN